MANTQCDFWDCKRPKARAIEFCLDHYWAERQGKIDKCPKCERYKDVKNQTCLECDSSISHDRVGRSQPQGGRRPDGSYVREHSPKWDAGDAETDEWFVYILQFSDKTYYVGQTNDLRVRLTEHRDGKTKGTRNKRFELVWFTTVFTRGFAETLEAELKEMRDQNERRLRSIILYFQDSVKEMDIFRT